MVLIPTWLLCAVRCAETKPLVIAWWLEPQATACSFNDSLYLTQLSTTHQCIWTGNRVVVFDLVKMLVSTWQIWIGVLFTSVNGLQESTWHQECKCLGLHTRTHGMHLALYLDEMRCFWWSSSHFCSCCVHTGRAPSPCAGVSCHLCSSHRTLDPDTPLAPTGTVAHEVEATLGMSGTHYPQLCREQA